MNPEVTDNVTLLCDELWLLILKYVGKHRRSTSLVCKRFYKLNCEIDRNKIPLKISNEWLENREVYNSMSNTCRIFNAICLDTNKVCSLMEFWRLRNIIFVHGENIKRLVWDSCKMTRIEVVSLLNLLPNLEMLECISWKIESQFFDEPNETLNLPYLKELKILKSNVAAEEFFTNMPHHIIRLRSLSTDFDSCKILEQQPNVTALDLNVELLSECDLLSNLPTLSHLTMMLRRYQTNGYQILHSLLPFQPKLNYLDLIRCEGIFDGDDDSFVCICNMKDLKTLKINVDGLSVRAFDENFHKLSGLRELEIESVEHDFSQLVDIIEDLSKMNLVNVEALRIDVECIGIPLNRIEQFGRNFVNLRHFTLRCNMPLSLDSFLKNLRGLESIKIDYHYSREFSKICNEYEDGLTFPMLKQIELQGFNFGSEINSNETSVVKLIKMLPSLQSLDIDINLPFNSRLLCNLLTKAPALKVIRGLYMVQCETNNETFNGDFIKTLIEVSDKLQKFSIELKLKAVNMDVSRMKQILNEEFCFSMRKYGNFFIITLKKE